GGRVPRARASCRGDTNARNARRAARRAEHDLGGRAGGRPRSPGGEAGRPAGSSRIPPRARSRVAWLRGATRVVGDGDRPIPGGARGSSNGAVTALVRARQN